MKTRMILLTLAFVLIAFATFCFFFGFKPDVGDGFIGFQKNRQHWGFSVISHMMVDTNGTDRTSYFPSFAHWIDPPSNPHAK